MDTLLELLVVQIFAPVVVHVAEQPGAIEISTLVLKFVIYCRCASRHITGSTPNQQKKNLVESHVRTVNDQRCSFSHLLDSFMAPTRISFEKRLKSCKHFKAAKKINLKLLCRLTESSRSYQAYRPMPLIPLAPRERHLSRSNSRGSLVFFIAWAHFCFNSCSWRCVVAMASAFLFFQRSG